MSPGRGFNVAWLPNLGICLNNKMFNLVSTFREGFIVEYLIDFGYTKHSHPLAAKYICLLFNSSPNDQQNVNKLTNQPVYKESYYFNYHILW